MLLSIIIVNYNVKHFLEQCLYSVQNAIALIDNAEVIVVDNNSSDGSISYLQPNFPHVKFITNSQNIGFGKANNQAVQVAKGEYILFLNPDTLIPEDCFEKCINFLQKNPEAGALGIKMLDGCGRFLPESKRAFPDPLTSFFKLTGLASLFKRSKFLAKYYLGHLPKDQNHEVDVLAGAFMLIRKKVLDQVGVFDDLFFMYGEDIDLSYRIQQAGWKNYYLAESSIVHFKGESTRKGNLNYVKMFYKAMSLFVKKHYSGRKAATFHFFIQSAIWLRAGLTAMVGFIRRMGLPVLDAIIILCSLLVMEFFWKNYVKPGLAIAPSVLRTTLPLFTGLFIVTASIAGLYDKRHKPLRIWYAIIAAIVINLAAYSLLNEQYRFSRGVVLLGGVLAAFGIAIFRWALVQAKVVTDVDESKKFRQTLIVGTVVSFLKVQEIMRNAGRNERILGRITTGNDYDNVVGDLNHLDDLLQSLPVRELILCIEPSLPMKGIINIIQQKKDIRYKFHYAGSQSIVGSDSKETIGEALTTETVFKINHPSSIRAKRIVDVLCSLFFLLTIPIHLLLIKKQIKFIKNVFNVLLGKKTWVGYYNEDMQLPQIKQSIISPSVLSVRSSIVLKKESIQKINHWYAKDYEWTDDIKLILKGYQLLGC